MNADPIPGNAGELERAAVTFSGLSGSVTIGRNILRKAGDWINAHDSWAGPAATSFSGVVATAVRDLGAVHHLMHVLDTHLRAYADTVLLAQRALARAQADHDDAQNAGDADGMLSAHRVLVQTRADADHAAQRLLAILRAIPPPPAHSWMSAPIPAGRRIREPHGEWIKGQYVGGWVPEMGTLYAPGGPKLSDIQQGATGDCFFLATVGAMLKANPKAIEKMIHDNGDGTYTVTFADGRTETVDAKTLDFTDLQAPDGNYGYATTGFPLDAAGVPVLWVLILEKAYAERRHGYSAITQGGDPASVMSLVDPHSKGGWLDPSTTSPRDIGAVIGDALHTHTPIVAGTPTTFSDPALAKRLNLISDHAYYITGYDPATGMVSLGNPWGTSPALTPKPISVKDFPGLFNELAAAIPA